MRYVGVLALVVVVAAMPLALACKPPTPVGESLGTFAVHGELEQNGCAPGLSPIDPLDFQVDLRRDRANLRWQRAGGPPVSGVLGDDGAFRLVIRSQVEAWPADPANGVAGCSLTQTETIEATMHFAVAASDGAVALDAGRSDAGPDDASFVGTDEIEILPVAGTNCSALLLVNGGSFPTLPCAAQYALTGSAR